MASCRRRAVPYDLEYRVRRYDGEYEWFKVEAKPIRDSAGNITRWFGIGARIHDLKKAQEELARSEKRLRQLADSIPQIVWASRPDGCLDFYNRKWYELTGADPNATGDQSWLPILHPDDRQKCLDIWYDSVRTGKPYYIEYRFKFPGSGEYRWHIGRALPAKDEQGNIIRWYGTSTDIHDFKVAQDKLTDLKTAFENRSKELETIMGIVSHDLRAPLVNVRGFAKEINKDISMLQKTLEQEPSSQETLKKIAPLFENFRQATHFISSSAESMDNLAVLLVNITRAGLAETKPKKLDMNEIINKIVASIKFKLKETEVAYDICGALPSCFGDKQQVTQIFTNLLDNAVKYLDPAGRVRSVWMVKSRIIRHCTLLQITASASRKKSRRKSSIHIISSMKRPPEE